MSIFTLAAISLQLAGAQAGAPSVTIEGFVGDIVIEQGARLEARVERHDGNQAVAINDTPNGFAIDGGHSVRRWGCYGRGDDRRVGRNRMNAKPFSQYPLLVITAPDPIALSVQDSIVRGEAGRLNTLDLGARSCGSFQTGPIDSWADVRLSGSMRVTLGDIGGDADLSLSGSGRVEAGNIGGDLEAGFSGSGGVVAGDVTGLANVRGSGSGGAQLGTISGPLSVRLSGSGDVEAGNTGPLSVTTSGSGDVEVGDVAGPVEFNAGGSGDLVAGDVLGLSMSTSGSAAFVADTLTGAFDASVRGSGSVRVEDGRAAPFIFSSSGSGSARFGGTVINPDIRLSGSGGVRVGAVEGSQNVSSRGSGRFTVTGEASR